MEHNEYNFSGEELTQLTLAEIVQRNFHSAAVFEKYGLDFCCRGNKPVSQACEEKGLNQEEILTELRYLGNKAAGSVRHDEWGLDFMIDYIINTHHEYVRKMIPVLSAHTEKIATVHGIRHPELIEIAKKFSLVYKELKQHMFKEEQILFPYIKQMVKAAGSRAKFEAPYFGSVTNPIKMMEVEHQNAGDELFGIRDLSNNYAVPEDACNTYRITMLELKEFEEDLHKHVHLENNILFPKSVKLEQELKEGAYQI